jgi:hypothetical protein
MGGGGGGFCNKKSLNTEIQQFHRKTGKSTLENHLKMRRGNFVVIIAKILPPPLKRRVFNKYS